jgi:dephospho-CoA kinase
MLRVGLTGGLATGKSFVGDALHDLGCALLRADELGHEVLAPGGEAYAPVVEAFGREILDEQGLIVRRRLAALVFDDPERLRFLNSLVHPSVIAREEAWMQQVEDADPRAIAVVEAAILIETGSYKRFHKIILTVCAPEQQIERSMKRDGLTRQEVLARLSRQMPLDEKRRYADYVIDTSGEKSSTLEQVKQLYDQLRGLNP